MIIKLLMTGRTIMIAMFLAMLLGFSVGFAAAQTGSFSQTGQIRLIIFETKTKIPSRVDFVNDAGFRLSDDAQSKAEFYFTYSAFENGMPTEKWVSLSDDTNWSRFSNRPVRVSGRLKNNKLANVEVSPLTPLPEDYLRNPPPTAGLYKVVAVPLTIQSSSVAGRDAVLNVTPEAIRNNLFNAPDAVNKFYLEASYGKFGFAGVNHPQVDVVPVTIQATIAANCQEQIVTEFTPIVRQRLLEQNINTTNGSVDLGIIIFNDTPGCPPYPFATRGALGQRGVPQWLWMPESWFVTGPLILAHEIAHTLGGNHPLALRCTDFDNPQTCVAVDAADRDIMTSGGRFYQMPNNYERQRWGWHPPGAFDNPASGSVRLFDLQPSILPAIKDGAKQGRFYFQNLAGAYPGWYIYPEARRNWGRFERYQEGDESFRLGVAVRMGHGNYGDPEAFSVIIDPNTTTQLEDAPLRRNQQVSIGGVSITCTREYTPSSGTRMKVER